MGSILEAASLNKQIKSSVDIQVWDVVRGKLREKLMPLNLSNMEELVEVIVGRLRSRAAEEPFEWWDETGSRSIDIEAILGQDSFKEIEPTLNLVLEKLPKFIEDITTDLSKSIHRTLRKDWPQRRSYEEIERDGFERRLSIRWGDALSSLNMIKLVSIEHGQDYQRRLSRSKAKKDRFKRNSLSLLHIRSCRVLAEIVRLLETGFADGAMARWRTLHELGVIAALIAENSELVAERYFQHRAYDDFKELEIQQETYKVLGYRPIPESIENAARERLKVLTVKFGASYLSDYGWAAPLVNGRKPTFRELEVLAQKAHMRLHYKMSNRSIHAGSKALFHSHAGVDGKQFIHVGPTNAGLEEAGQNACITMTQINIWLCAKQFDYDTIVLMKLFLEMKDKCVDSFISTSRTLRREHKLKETKTS